MNGYETEILYGVGDLGKSRSQKKRESTALQELGEGLSILSASKLSELGVTQELCKAIADWQGMKKHEARRRQMQYIGRLMRELDEEEQERLSSELENLRRQQNDDAEQMHLIEDLRERLISEQGFDSAMQEIKRLFPSAQEKQIKHLAQAAAAEKNNPAKAKKSTAYRELFRHLRALANESTD